MYAGQSPSSPPPPTTTAAAGSSSSSSSYESNHTSMLDNILALPEEVLVGVLGTLALADLCRASAACRTLHRLATDDRLLWRARCAERYGPQTLESRAEGSTWEEHWDVLEEHFEHGRKLFNQKVEEGLSYLFEHKMLPQEPEAVAKFLVTTPGLKKKSIGWVLGMRAKDCPKDEETNLDIVCTPDEVEDFFSRTAQLYIGHIDFRNTTVDEALRALLRNVKLPGSSQFIRRILKDFAQVYCQQNTEEAQRVFKKPEGAYIAAYSILMLNTDQHNPKVSRRMKKEEFMEYFGGMLAGLPKEYVEGIYDRIKANELQIAEDHTADDNPESEASSSASRSNEGERKGFRVPKFISRFF